MDQESNCNNASNVIELSFPDDRFTRELVCELCRQFYSLGWVTGTGGSISIRKDDYIYMTPSGVQKERINPDEIFVLNREGQIIHTPQNKPGFKAKLSDCSPLFMHAYKQRNAGAVIHSHGISCNIITALFDGKSEFRLSYQEMIKGLRGLGYKDELVIPIIKNTPHEHELADSLGEAIALYPTAHAVLVRRHGMYVWGATWEEAKRHGECLHYLFEVCIQMKQLGLDYTKPAVTAMPASNPVIVDSVNRPAKATRRLNDQDVHSNGHGNGTNVAHEYYLFDIEGTTTPISFVKDLLFPYSQRYVKTYLVNTWQDVQTRHDVESLLSLILTEGTFALERCAMLHEIDNFIKECGSISYLGYIERYHSQPLNYNSQLIDLVVDFFCHCVDQDRKLTALKQLQGRIWKHGYEIGEIQSEVFPDVPRLFSGINQSAIKALSNNEVPSKIAIYSSGSRQAQQLLFRYSRYGDLSKYISCYFDTTIGMKREAKSYGEIALSLGCGARPDKILFFTDIGEEAEAAANAGMHVALLSRPGNAQLDKHIIDKFRVLADFDNVLV